MYDSFASERQFLLRLKPLAGSNIAWCAEEAAALAKQFGLTVQFSFNDAILEATPDGTGPGVHEQYAENLRKRLKPTAG